MTATLIRHTELTKALVDARLRRVQIERPDPAWGAMGEDDAYLAMLSVARQLQWPTLGWKIAGTNVDMQRRLRTQGPVFGRTFQRFLTHSPARFEHVQLLDPLVESEFFFRVGTSLEPRERNYSTGEVADAIQAVFIGIEIAECRFAQQHLPAQNALIADGFASGRYVQGRPVADWQRVLDDAVPVSVQRNGIQRATGSSSDVMGHPIHAVTWLVNRLSSMGIPLLAGELVSSGSCTGMVRARAGDHVEASFGHLGSVAVDFD